MGRTLAERVGSDGRAFGRAELRGQWLELGGCKPAGEVDGAWSGGLGLHAPGSSMGRSGLRLCGWLPGGQGSEGILGGCSAPPPSFIRGFAYLGAAGVFGLSLLPWHQCASPIGWILGLRFWVGSPADILGRWRPSSAKQQAGGHLWGAFLGLLLGRVCPAWRQPF